MRSKVFAAGISGLALVAVGLSGWLWWPPAPEEPGFRPLDLPEVRLWFRPREAEARAEELRIRAPETVVWLESSRRLGPVLFQVGGRPARVVVRSGGSKEEYLAPSSGAGERIFLEWQPDEPRRYRGRPDLYFYRLVLAFPDRAGSGSGDAPALAFLGTRETLGRDYYRVEWLGCGAPETVRAGEELPVLARARNASPNVWPHRGNARVRLAARWLDGEAPPPPVLTDLGAPVEPGGEVARWLRPRAPDRPGRHTLELDFELEPLARFSEKGAPTCRADVDVE